MCTLKAEELIRQLDLTRHPEGGWYRENYRSAGQISDQALPDRFKGARSFSTAIYFLLEQNDFSSFHRIQSDELWHYYTGSPASIHLITADGNVATLLLGPDISQSQHFQFVIPAGC